MEALLGRDVDLDAVEEVEERLGARPLPHHRVERAEQRARGDPAREPGVAVEVALALPALHGDRGQLPRLDELLDRDLGARLAGRGLEAQAVVVGEVGPARHAVGPGGQADEPGDRVLRRRRRRVEHGGRQHPLGQVVEHLELAGAPGDRDVADEEEVVEDLARLRPVPAPVLLGARAGAELLLEVARRHRSAVADRVEHARLEVGVGREAPLAALGAVLLHPVAHQRPQLDRHQRLDVRPVLHEVARAAAVVLDARRSRSTS